ncbi:MAG: DUF1553 domain-containing protein [Saprospiraceae bacterium]|nr:DUF1553 domain-containing protein [Saprospiraceae bacterium]
MFELNKAKLLIAALMGAFLLFIFFNKSFEKKVDFNTEIKPILNQKCISCHGGVKQSAGLSMMTRSDLLKAGESGYTAIVPGKPQESELFKRITHSDPDERMPFEGAPLSKSEIKLFKNWINQGAKWGEHWAFMPVKNVKIPKVEIAKGMIGLHQSYWSESPIDAFILQKLNAKHLTPNPVADKRSLLRRLSLDLIGMPASEELKQQFLNDTSKEAYSTLVDQLMKSPHFGERWATMWLDLARYADSKGPERDAKRDIWEYRDWLIRSFNEDLPYDQFLIEQIAGDLLPNPSDAQYIATGFHRNTETNDEGGTNNDEARASAVVDRVNTTWEAIMGTTFACTQCHGHPYDPIRHEEYYEFMSYFDNTLDHDTYDDYPRLRTLTAEQKSELKKVLTWLTKNDFENDAKAAELLVRTWQPVYYSLRCDSLKNADIYDTKFLGMRNKSFARLAQVDLDDKNNLIVRYSNRMDGGWWSLHLDSPDGLELARVKAKNTKGRIIEEYPLKGELSGKHDLYFKYENPHLGTSTVAPLQFDWFHFGSQFPGKDLPDFEKIKNLYWDLICANTEHTLIMVENPPGMHRATKVWDRGSWASQKEEVQPDLPEIFKKDGIKIPKSRLGLAEWLVSPQNPLTSRTIVNRIWEQLMGRGIVETLEDLGTQGIPPTHPELLEYLSWKMMYDFEWSLKALIKAIVTSATYQQSSTVSPQALKKDPLNILYSRAARLRLSAEQLRDQALSVSGLLHDTMYGPPVMPYQPPDIWAAPYNSSRWNTSVGNQKYRRAIYTFWKRSAPFPAMITFDAAPRTVCSARRIRTNTPLQALVTLNDSAYVEAAVNLALLQLHEKKAQIQIAKAYEKAIGRSINGEKLAVLEQLFNETLKEYREDEIAVRELLGYWLKDKKVEASPELAALTLVANAILNLDEFITRS